MRAFSVTFCAAMLLSTPAVAQPAGGGGGDDADASAFKGQQGGATVYDFEDDNVDGEILSPEGALISSRGRSKHASLITIRPHFIPELIKMSMDI